MKVLNFKGCCQEQINQVTEYMIDNCIDCESINNDADLLLISDEDAELIETEEKFEYYDFHIENCTYDIVFNDDNNTNSKGYNASYEYCKEYIDRYNGTNESYFENYKGGTVSIICNETEIIAFETEIK